VPSPMDYKSTSHTEANEAGGTCSFPRCLVSINMPFYTSDDSLAEPKIAAGRSKRFTKGKSRHIMPEDSDGFATRAEGTTYKDHNLD
jgi:hypothetical protein